MMHRRHQDLSSSSTTKYSSGLSIFELTPALRLTRMILFIIPFLAWRMGKEKSRIPDLGLLGCRPRRLVIRN